MPGRPNRTRAATTSRPRSTGCRGSSQPAMEAKFSCRRRCSNCPAAPFPAGTELLDLGDHRLRDLLEPERVYQLLHPDLPADFPPLQTLAGHPNNLPHQPTPLLGRERELGEIADLLRHEDVHLVTLTGPGGVGKTRLALQAAADLLEVFPDGAFFVELAPLADPALVPSTVAGALGVREEGGQSARRRC